MSSTHGPLFVVGAGVVGSALAERRRTNDPARGLVLSARSVESVRALEERGFHAIPLDLVGASDDGLRRALSGAAVIVFSAAAGRGGDYAALYDGGTARLASIVAETGAHLVYTSSTGVYAARDGEWVDEDAPLTTHDDRTRALVRAEHNVIGAGGTVLRLSGILSPDRGPHRRAEALAGSVRDDGEAWLNLAPLPTIVDALGAVIERDWRGVVNVSAARPWTRRAFYDAALARAGCAPIQWRPTPPDADHGRRVRVDRLRAELGVEPLDVDAVWSAP